MDQSRTMVDSPSKKLISGGTIHQIIGEWCLRAKMASMTMGATSWRLFILALMTVRASTGPSPKSHVEPRCSIKSTLLGSYDWPDHLAMSTFLRVLESALSPIWFQSMYKMQCIQSVLIIIVSIAVWEGKRCTHSFNSICFLALRGTCHTNLTLLLFCDSCQNFCRQHSL